MPKRRKAVSDSEEDDDRKELDEATGTWVAYQRPDSPDGRNKPQQQQQTQTHTPSAAPETLKQPLDQHDWALDPGDVDGSGSTGYYSDDSSNDGEVSSGAAAEPHSTGLAAFADGVMPLLAVDADKRQGVFAVRWRRPSQRKWRFAFLGFRRMGFSDGEQLIGYSKDCPCGAGSSLHEALEDQDRLGHRKAWLPAPRMCQCGEELLAILGGEGELQRLFAISAAGDSENIVKELSIASISYTAVRAGPAFVDWAMLDCWGRCINCPSRQWVCQHVQCLPETAAADSLATMSEAAFEAKLSKEFDLERGCRRTACISQQRLPEDLPLPEQPRRPNDPVWVEDMALLTLITERGEGKQPLPQHCAPTSEAVEQQRCKECGACDWQTDSPCTQPSLVFLRAAFVSVFFIFFQCGTPGCTGILQVDGKEYGLLRKSSGIAFGLCLLYSWLDAMSTGGAKWWRYWRDTLMAYKRLTVERQREMMRRYRRVFQAATFDFISLMNIDWRAAFTCPNGAREVTADGIRIGHKLSQSYLMRPWEPPPDGSLTPGALLRSRLFVVSAEDRRLLQQFTASMAGGLSAADLARLTESFEAQEGLPEHTLLPFLRETAAGSGDTFLAAAQWRPLLRDLGTTAPAIQMLPTNLWDATRKLIAHKKMPAAAESDMLRYSPVLHGFLRPYLGAKECNADVLLFVCKLLEVARSSVTPDPLAACRATGSRRGGDQPRPAPPLPDEGPAATARPPSLWTAEETFRRTGVWCGLPAGTDWQPSALGGSHVKRPLRLYAADSFKMGGSASDCNKWQRSAMKLIPGYMLVWCACCGFCVMFAIMRDAESPRTLFDLIYTHMEQPPQQFQLDNGCNLHSFGLAREPEHFRNMRVLVDEPHYRGHTNCSQGYNTGNYPHIKNSPLAEQKNAVLRQLEGQLAYMNQLTSLQYLRIFLYRMNKMQARRAAGQCFFD